MLALVLLVSACGDDTVEESTTTTAPPTTVTTTTATATTTTTTLPPVAEWGDPWLWLLGVGGTLYEVDGTTGEVAATVDVGENLSAMALGPGGIWVSECEADLVHLIAPGSAEVVASVPVEGCPADLVALGGEMLVLSRDRGRLFRIDPTGEAPVAEFFLGQGHGSELLLPLVLAQVAAYIIIVGIGDEPGEPAVAAVSPSSPDSSQVLVLDADGNLVSYIDVGARVRDVALAAGLVMVGLEGGLLQWFDAASGEKLGEEPTGFPLFSVVFTGGMFCATAPGSFEAWCGNPAADVPFAPISAPSGTVAMTAYGLALYGVTSEGELWRQAIGASSGVESVGQVAGALVSGMAVVARGPAEGGNQAQVCPGLPLDVPAGALAAAQADPATVPGWGQPCNPTLPPGPYNLPRTFLGLPHPGSPYHPLYNSPVFKCGCP
jgi:hypothetical protein